MAYLLFKVFVTAVIIVSVTELSRRFSLFAAALASLPLVSILSFIWIHVEGGDGNKLTALSHDIFWLVLPSLVFFVLFPMFLKQGMSFWTALLGAAFIMSACYGLVVVALRVMS